MRIAWQQPFRTAEYGLQRLQQRLLSLQQQLATGKQITSPADDPSAYSRARRLDLLQELTERRIQLLQAMSQEQQLLHTFTEALEDTLLQVRQLLVQALDPKNLDKPAFLAQQLRQRLDDMLALANAHADGRYLLGGTRTLFPDGQGPFLLRQELPTQENPSGLRVEFRGTFTGRSLELFPGQPEILSLQADELFGRDGVELFTLLLGAYNLLAYRADGSPRAAEEGLSSAERERLEALLPQVAAFQASLARATARVGARQERWELLQQQLQNYATHLRAFRSAAEDADLARLAVELHQGQTALQALLQTSARLLGLSLFDVLR